MSTIATRLVELADLYEQDMLCTSDRVLAPVILFHLAQAIIAGTYTCTTKEV